MSKESKYVPCHLLLDSEQIETLSPASSILYTAIWNRLRARDATEASLADSGAMKLAGCSVELLQTAKSELHRAS